MIGKSDVSGVREVGKMPHSSFRLWVYGVWQRIVCVHQLSLLCLLCTHLDYISKPSLQLGGIMSLSSGLQMLAEVVCTISRLAHKITLHNPPCSLLLYFLAEWRGLWGFRGEWSQRVEGVWVSQWLCKANPLHQPALDCDSENQDFIVQSHWDLGNACYRS